jgi:hypothetical protein
MTGASKRIGGSGELNPDLVNGSKLTLIDVTD